MTIFALVLGTIASEILFVLTKVIFIHYLNIDNFFIQLMFFLVLIILTTAVVRRMGILNYLECFFLSTVWVVVMLLVDMAVTSTLIGREMYHHIYYWLSYLMIVLSVIFFHKALHVQVRNANIKK